MEKLDSFEQKTLNLAMGKIVAYRTSFAKVFKSVTTAILLSQYYYWTTKETTQNRDGWFFKTEEEMYDEAGLTKYEQRSAREKLKELYILESKLEGIPAKTWYRINLKNLAHFLDESSQIIEQTISKDNDEQVVDKTDYKGLIKPTAIYTEITTKITDIDKKEKILKAKPLWKEVNYLKLLPPKDVDEFVAKFPSLGKEKILHEADCAYDWLHSTGKIHKYTDFKAFFRNWLRKKLEFAQKQPISKAPTTVNVFELNYFKNPDVNEDMFGSFEYCMNLFARESEFTEEYKTMKGSDWIYYHDWVENVKKNSMRVYEDLMRRYKEKYES